MAVIGDDNIIKVTKYNINRCSVTVPSWNNNDDNYRQIGSQTMTVSPVAANSKFIIDINIMMFNVSSHGYITLKRGGTSGTWLHRNEASDQDGLFANHSNSTTEYWNAGFRYMDSPSQNNTNDIVYVPYVGMWSGTTLYLGSYSNNGNAEMPNMCMYITEVAA